MHHAAYPFFARRFFAEAVYRALAPVAIVVVLWLGGAAPALSQQPSFDCAASHAPDEVAICSNFALAQLDRQLNDMYNAARERLGPDRQEELRDSQRAWLRERSACGRDVKCITRLYQRRIPELSTVAAPEPTEPIHGANSGHGEEEFQERRER